MTNAEWVDKILKLASSKKDVQNNNIKDLICTTKTKGLNKSST